jgi:hypothetical protein
MADTRRYGPAALQENNRSPARGTTFRAPRPSLGEGELSMRTRTWAGLFAAGLGLMTTGCWSTTPNPATRNPNQNIPRQAISTGFQNNTPAGGAASGGQPAGTMTNGAISRTSGAPADPGGRIGMTSGATAGAAGATGGAMPYLTAPPAGNGVQPIATSDPGAGRGIQPAVNVSRGSVTNASNPPADLDPTPSAKSLAPAEKDFPAALSAAGLDKPPSFERKAPAMPSDLPAVSPSGPPMPNKIRAIDPLDQLPPPPK